MKDTPQLVCARTCSRYAYGHGYCRKHGQAFYQWRQSNAPCPDFKPAHRKNALLLSDVGKPKPKPPPDDPHQIKLNF